jgi:hypothetical protein
MNNINSLYTQQSSQVTRNTSLRATAGSQELPKLTADESSLIKEKFTSNKAMELYSGDGKMTEHQFSRGSKIDTRI